MTKLEISRCDRCGCDIEYPMDNLYEMGIEEKTMQTANWVFFVGGPLKIKADLCRLCCAAMVLEYNKFGMFQFSNITKEEIEAHEETHRKEYTGEDKAAPVVAP